MERTRHCRTKRGSYSLLVRLPRSRTVRVGKLGTVEFARGCYVYTGSAMSGLEGRIGHHLGRKSRPRWHVDFLLAAPGARVERWVEWETRRRSECALNRRFLRAEGAAVPVKGFGSSDCRESCPAHLVYFERRPDIEKIAHKVTRR
ncbi:MAG: GIY-YIG nuclease family protein [Candidatus Hydrogenedentes bacterium]|nr:GIY-YIG nuclease family protein [Candidatus Hydrogenedentota bacterium]